MSFTYLDIGHGKYPAFKQSPCHDLAHAGIAQESRIRENTAGEGVRAAAGRVHG